MRQSQYVAIDSIKTEKQPSAQLRLNRMMTITQRGLRSLGPRGLDVSEEHPLHGSAALHLPPQRRCLPTQGRARALDGGPRKRGIAAQDESQSNPAFAPRQRDFGTVAVLQDAEQRHNTRPGKVEVLLAVSWLVPSLAWPGLGGFG